MKNNQSNKTVVNIGLDISTTCTGITIQESKTGKLLLMKHFLMNNDKKFPDFWSKVDFINQEIESICDPNWSIRLVAVEENMKMFAAGRSSADTIMTLAKFNGILCYLFYLKFGVKPTYVNVRTARSTLGLKINYKDKSKSTKQKVLAFISNMHPEFPWEYKIVKGVKSLKRINEDMADSYVIAEASRLTYPIAYT